MSGVTVQTRIASSSDAVDAALLERDLGGLDGHVRSGDAGGGDVALRNSDALHNPLVGGVDHLFEILIGQHVGRSVAAQRGYFCVIQSVSRSRIQHAGKDSEFRIQNGGGGVQGLKRRASLPAGPL